MGFKGGTRGVSNQHIKKQKDDKLNKIRQKVTIPTSSPTPLAQNAFAPCRTLSGNGNVTTVTSAINGFTKAQCGELLGISDGMTSHPERLARQIAPRFSDLVAQVEVNIEELQKSRDALYHTFVIKFCENYCLDNGRYGVSKFVGDLRSRLEFLQRQEEIDTEVARRLSEASRNGYAPGGAWAEKGPNRAHEGLFLNGPEQGFSSMACIFEPQTGHSYVHYCVKAQAVSDGGPKTTTSPRLPDILII